ILFVASLVILFGGLIISYTVTADKYYLMIVPLIAMPIGLLTTWWSVRLTNQYVRKPHAEDVMQAAFKGAGAHSVAYHYLFKANHVLVCPQGVYAIVARFQDGIFRVQGERILNARGRNPIGGFMTLMRQEQMGSPIHEAQMAAAELQTQLDEALAETESGPSLDLVIQPLVVFTSEKADLDIQQDPPIPVVLAAHKPKRPSLKVLLRAERAERAELPEPNRKDRKRGGSGKAKPRKPSEPRELADGEADAEIEPLLSASQITLIEEALNSHLAIQTPHAQSVADDPI
ncbi:MAG: hypothetical protein ACYDBJ_18425, partial [Aggregatilineales bacterium]